MFTGDDIIVVGYPKSGKHVHGDDGIVVGYLKSGKHVHG